MAFFMPSSTASFVHDTLSILMLVIAPPALPRVLFNIFSFCFVCFFLSFFFIVFFHVRLLASSSSEWFYSSRMAIFFSQCFSGRRRHVSQPVAR